MLQIYILQTQSAQLLSLQIELKPNLLPHVHRYTIRQCRLSANAHIFSEYHVSEYGRYDFHPNHKKDNIYNLFLL